MSPEIPRNGEGAIFIKGLACKWVEESTRAYFTTDPRSLKRLETAIAVEDNQRIANFLGVPAADIIRASLRGTPKGFRQDYLDTVYDSGVLFGGDTEQIANEFRLVSPTLGL